MRANLDQLLVFLTEKLSVSLFKDQFAINHDYHYHNSFPNPAKFPRIHDTRGNPCRSHKSAFCPIFHTPQILRRRRQDIAVSLQWKIDEKSLLVSQLHPSTSTVGRTPPDKTNFPEARNPVLDETARNGCRPLWKLFWKEGSGDELTFSYTHETSIR